MERDESDAIDEQLSDGIDKWGASRFMLEMIG